MDGYNNHCTICTFFSHSVFSSPRKKRITDRRGELLWVLYCADEKYKLPHPTALIFQTTPHKKSNSECFKNTTSTLALFVTARTTLPKETFPASHDFGLVAGVGGPEVPTGCCPCRTGDSDPRQAAATRHDTPRNTAGLWKEGKPPTTPNPRRNRQYSLVLFELYQILTM